MKDPIITLKQEGRILLECSLWTLIHLRIYDGDIRLHMGKEVELYLDEEEVEPPVEEETG